MPRRPVLAADTPAAALRYYVLNAITELFHTPRVLPILRRDPPPPDPPLPMLFKDLPDQCKGEPVPVPPAPEPEPAPELDPRDFPNSALMARIVGGVLPPPSELAIRRRRLKRERAEAAAAAREVEVDAPEPEPEAEQATPFLTMDMGPWMKAHYKDKIDFEPRIGHPHRVACPPFHLHDEEHVEPVDEFLGQVVGIKAARALLFRRRDPDIMDGCEVGGRYVALRFWDDKEGQVWSMPLWDMPDDNDDRPVFRAIEATTAIYQGRRR